MGKSEAKKEKFLYFFTTGLWEKRLGELSGKEALFFKTFRVIALGLKGFLEDKCTLRASALTFYSLLAIVPVLAMAFGIAKGFGLRQRLRGQLLEAFSGQEEILTQAIDFADKLLESASGGTVAGIGVVVLFWSVIKVLGHIEESFNVIWEVRTQRPLGRRFSNYLSIMLLSPMVVIISGSLTVFISAQVTYVVDKVGLLGIFAPLVFTALKFLPYTLMWFLLAFVYITVPNTRVGFKSGMVGAVVAGTMYQILQWLYITFQIGISKYNAIYGSFAAMPLFLMWLNLSWIIVLLGAELSYATQNAQRYDLEPEARRASPMVRKRLCLLMAHLVVKAFVNGEGAVRGKEVPTRLGLPPRLAEELLAELVEAGILSECGDTYTRDFNYQPSLATDRITIRSVLEALDKRGSDVHSITGTPGTKEENELTEALQTLNEDLFNSPANRLLRDI
ncbi:MAG: YihY family inner membrane protein [Proteobacteria bacterium]|nr:YihY family inner membrane protein [Pseudomonadota bacterium]